MFVPRWRDTGVIDVARQPQRHFALWGAKSRKFLRKAAKGTKAKSNFGPVRYLRFFLLILFYGGTSGSLFSAF